MYTHMKKLLPILVLVLVLAGGGYFVMKSRTPKESMAPTVPQESAMPALDETGTEEMIVASNVKEFTIDTSEFAFDVKRMNVKVGDTVRVTLTNSGKMSHDWVVDELGAKTKQITNGETDMIEFVPTEAGTFEYYCSVGQHRANGMVGSIIVEE